MGQKLEYLQEENKIIKVQTSQEMLITNLKTQKIHSHTWIKQQTQLMDTVGYIAKCKRSWIGHVAQKMIPNGRSKFYSCSQ